MNTNQTAQPNAAEILCDRPRSADAAHFVDPVHPSSTDPLPNLHDQRAKLLNLVAVRCTAPSQAAPEKNSIPENPQPAKHTELNRETDPETDAKRHRNRPEIFHPTRPALISPIPFLVLPHFPYLPKPTPQQRSLFNRHYAADSPAFTIAPCTSAPAFAVAIFQAGNFVGGREINIGVVLPGLFFGIDEEGARKHFDFVAEDVQRDCAGKISEIVETNAAVGKVEAVGLIESNGDSGVGDLFAGDEDADVLNTKGRVVDDEERFAIGGGNEIDPPWAFVGAQAGVAGVKTNVADDGQSEGDGGVFENVVARRRWGRVHRFLR
jgi:hypothetical protein